MEFFQPWIEALRNAPPHYVKFLLGFVLVIFLLRKIKIRRPRSWDDGYQNRKTPSGGGKGRKETPTRKKRKTRTPSNGRRKARTPSDAQDKGRRGEELIARILHDTVAGEFELFQNVYVPKDGGTSEIDLLMIHEKGIFVFESKNYNGRVSGSADALNWVHIHPNRKKYSFYNPVRQNANHIRALSRYLRIPERRFYSYVVFSDKCKPDRIPENTRSVVVTQTSRLAEDLEHTLSASPTLCDAEEIRAVADRIAPLTDVSEEAKAKHIEDIRNRWESDLCPFCGAELVLRRGRRGDFWACPSYPKCKFKRAVER